MREAGSSSDPMVLKMLSNYKTAVIDNLFSEFIARIQPCSS